MIAVFRAEGLSGGYFKGLVRLRGVIGLGDSYIYLLPNARAAVLANSGDGEGNLEGSLTLRIEMGQLNAIGGLDAMRFLVNSLLYFVFRELADRPYQLTVHPFRGWVHL